MSSYGLSCRLSREGQLFEMSLRRPSNYYNLSQAQQWRVDSDLGILDWDGGCYHASNLNGCPTCLQRFKDHFVSHSQ